VRLCSNSLSLSLAAFLIGLALVLAWADGVFGDWATFIFGGALLSIGVYYAIEDYEDYRGKRR
jgi:1,4-dihydroxy-2-naphthoate octaprenyltransferase